MLRAVPPAISPTVAVDPPEAEGGHGAGRSLDRRAPLLRVHAGVRRPAAEAHAEGARERRSEDDLADRRRLVVHVADAGVELAGVERARSEEADLLLGREEQLDARVGASVLEDPPRRLEHHRDGGLVVRPEDRARGVADDPVLADDRLDRPLGGHGVEVRAEEDRRPGAVRAGQPAEHVARARPDAPAGVVLRGLEAERLEVGEHAVGDRPLRAGRARDRAELQEEVEEGRRRHRPES
jgi:hypothetical protein